MVLLHLSYYLVVEQMSEDQNNLETAPIINQFYKSHINYTGKKEFLVQEAQEHIKFSLMLLTAVCSWGPSHVAVLFVCFSDSNV